MRTLSLVPFLALVPALPHASGSQTLIIDSGDATDWVRLLADYAWKDQDTILRPVSLLRMRLNDIPPGTLVAKAQLFFYVEQTQLGGTVSVNDVEDDGWSFLGNTPH